MVTIVSYNKRLEALRTERSPWMSWWKELSDYHLAHRGRFLTQNRNKPVRNTKQINNISRLAARTLASGMMAGITSPARPWFKLSSGDKKLDEIVAVKKWLHTVQGVMYRIFSSSNLYNSLHTTYSELGVFGTPSLGIYKDFENVIWCEPYTTGSFMIATNGKNVVDTFAREYQQSVGQCVKQFGYKNCSDEIQRQWDTGNTEAWVNVVRFIEPNDDRDHNSPMARDMAFRAVYYEHARSGKGSETKFLKRSGFDDFPILAPRWDVSGGDIYATDCPGMTAIGDTKSLQLGETRMYQALDVVGSPPLQGPASLRDKVEGGNVRGGDIIWTTGDAGGLESIYGNYKPDLGAILSINERTETRVQRAFYEDLFLMLANSDRRQITAREVAEKHEEKLLMLGPVLERLHTELLDLLIDRTFNIAQEEGIFPLPPPELDDANLNVEYVSILAQAQRMVATGSIERVSAFTAELSAIWPEARHKFNPHQAIDEYADAVGTAPGVTRSDDEANELAAQEAAQVAQQQAAEQATGLAAGAKTLSEASLSEENVLGTMARNAGMV